MQHWFFLAGAIALEVAGTTSMKLSEGFTKLLPSVLLFVFYAASFVALTLALMKIEVGVAYAVWSGAGTALIAAIGILYFNETATLNELPRRKQRGIKCMISIVTPQAAGNLPKRIKFISILLIIVGVVGLNLSG
jgi:small multidrug resistance pump